MKVPLHRRWIASGAALVGALLGFASTAPAANIALSKPAFASFNNATAANVTDGSLTTEWNDNGGVTPPNDFIGIDLGAEVKPLFARIFWNANQPKGFSIDVATTVDLTNPDTNFNYGQGDWQTAYYRSSADAQPGSPDLIQLELPATSDGHTGWRYIRIQGVEPPSTSVLSWGVREFQVLDAPLPMISGVTKTTSGPMGNVTVRLIGPAGAPLSKATTSDANGAFSFTGLDAGDYTLAAYAPGQYAPATASVTVGTANVTQDLTFSSPAYNFTAGLPVYDRDFIATSGSPADQNAQTNGKALPADELPPGNAVWTTNTALPGGGAIGENMPGTLKFFFPPTANGQNNVINAAKSTLLLSPAHYAAVYLLQVAGDAPAYATATFNYTDGTSAPVLTSSGSSSYRFTAGNADTSNGQGEPTPGEDETIAFTVDKLYSTDSKNPVQALPFNVYMRTLYPDPTKTLASISFGDYVSGAGSTFQSKGLILGYSADALETPPALGSISGKATYNGQPVKDVQIDLSSYFVLTDANGNYSIPNVPAGTYTLTGFQPAGFAPITVSATVSPGQNLTGVDFNFTKAVVIVPMALSGPNVDSVSSDANRSDAFLTGSALGREYFPTGLYSPGTVPNPPADPGLGMPFWEVSTAPGVPARLPFNFVDYGDTPIQVGQPGYPAGGTPNSVLPSGAVFLPPQGVKIYNVYFAEYGIYGPINVNATMHYTDGTSESIVRSAGDWFGTTTADELSYLFMHGRHKIDVIPGQEQNTGATIKLNVLPFPVNPDKTLKDVTFYSNLWDPGSNRQKLVFFLAVSWEVGQAPAAASDLKVTVTNADSTPAAGAIVSAGPFNGRADASGVVLFRDLPAGVKLNVSAYKSGITKAATQANFTVPIGQTGANAATVNLTLPGSAPIFVPLTIAWDYDMIATADQPGDYRGASNGDRAFKAENLPQPTVLSGQPVMAAGVPFYMPRTATGYSNVLRQNGQTINVAPGHYSAINLAAAGMGLGGNNTLMYPIVLNYDDGTSQVSQLAVADWSKNFTAPDTTNQRIYFRQTLTTAFVSAGRYGATSDDAANVGFLPVTVPVDASKNLVSFTLAHMPQGIDRNDCSILGITLEANDTTATGTVTGKVVGKPAGATTSGPLARTMVKWDAGHAIYTDDSGNFTLNNVPLGPGTLTVTAEGSGILTKSFPVTVTASTNAGTLDLGAAVSQVSVLLGANNVSNGLKQVEGYPAPFIYDQNRKDFQYTVPDSGTRVVTIGGKTARETGYNNTYMYFQVDNGWLFRGRMGSIGLDTSTFAVNNGKFTGKLAPHLWMQVTYFDRGTDVFQVQFNHMRGQVHTGNLPTYDMLDGYRGYQIAKGDGTSQSYDFPKTGTNTWKTVVFEFDPQPADLTKMAENAFGAYGGQNLSADFRIDARSGTGTPPEDIASVILSTTPNFSSPPGSASDALRIIGGLQTATTDDVAALDVTGPAGTPDGKITLQDAVALARQGR